MASMTGLEGVDIVLMELEISQLPKIGLLDKGRALAAVASIFGFGGALLAYALVFGQGIRPDMSLVSIFVYFLFSLSAASALTGIYGLWFVIFRSDPVLKISDYFVESRYFRTIKSRSIVSIWLEDSGFFGAEFSRICFVLDNGSRKYLPVLFTDKNFRRELFGNAEARRARERT